MLEHLLIHSSSLKDLTKALSKSASRLSLPLPTLILDVIYAYLEKHNLDDAIESRNLQDELMAIYKSTIVHHPSSLAAFLVILQKLKFASRSSGRLLQWWDQLLNPILVNLGSEPRLAVETRDALLGLLMYDEDDDEGKYWENAKATSDAVTEILIANWLTATKQADEDLDDHSGFMAGHVQLVLIEYGKKRPKNFLTTLNKFFVRTESRILSLSLLCSFFRDPPPHLHQMLLTPLFINLLRCLQFDTSTRAVSLAMTALVMFLPHIPSITSQHLSTLFNIYTRLLFWDRVRRAEGISTFEVKESNNDAKENWTKLPYLLDSDDESVPELLHYFTFLYGLYPINFMSYVRKPHKYFNSANYLGVELDIQPVEVRQRSEPFRQVHLLHPNFFTFTLESELTDNNRWAKSDTADVVAECMALYVPSEDSHEHAQRSCQKTIDSDINRRYLNDISATSLLNDWHDVQSSDQIQNISSSQNQISDFIHDSSLKPMKQLENSGALPLETHPTSSQHRLTDILSSARSHKNSVIRNMTNDSVASLALFNHHESHIDSYLTSLSQDNLPSSSFVQRKTSNPVNTDVRLAYLYREIQLLRNDLNFERYLKQQHLSHIGQLRRKQIREARIEAETQNVITSNRTLKLKLEELKRLNTQLRKEGEKSKTHCRKWEAELSAKLRNLREEQKKWIAERENMTHDLEAAKNNQAIMSQIILQLEASELKSKQKATHVESSLEELESLRKEVEELNFRVRIYEVNEEAANAAKENEITAEARVTMLETELQARDRELIQAKETFQKEILSIQKDNQEASTTPNLETNLMQDMIDNALAISRSRIIELEKNYKNLLDRYSALLDEYYGFEDIKNERANDYQNIDSDSLMLSHSRPSEESNAQIFSNTSDKDQDIKKK